jgi:TRAP-type C4-dicarboxylate transport system substrate-binding protein
MPAPEIYNAMQTGVLDGAMIDATTLGAFKLAEVTTYITTGMDSTISDFFIVMNRDLFESLDETAQAAILDAGKAASHNGHAAWNGVAGGALESFAATEGKEVITLSDDEAAKFNAASTAAVEQILADAEAEGLAARAFVEALQAE